MPLAEFLPTTSYALKYAFAACILAISCFSLGSPLCTRLNKSAAGWEKFFFSTCLGMAIWSFSIFILGNCHSLDRCQLIGVLVLSFVPLGRELLRKKFAVIRISGIDSLFIIILIAATTLVFLGSLYPPFLFDDIGNHLAAAKIYCSSHALIPTPYLIYPVFPQFCDLLFAGLLNLSGDIGAQQLSVVSYGLVMIGIYSCLEKLSSKRAGLVGVLAWMSSNLAMRLATVAYTDENLALMTLSGSFAALRSVQCADWEARKRLAYLAGILFGCALSIKYSAFFFLLLFCLAALLMKLDRDGNSTFPVDLKNLGRIVSISCLVVSVWLLRNFLTVGNPVFPALSSVFGPGSIWNEHDYKMQIADLAINQGFPRTLANFFRAPWVLSFPFNSMYHLTVCPFLLPTLVLSLPLSLKPKSGAMRFLFLLALLCTVTWFFGPHYRRYFLVALPTICLLSGWTFDSWLKAIKLKPIRVVILALLVLYTFFHAISYALKELVPEPIPYDRGLRDAFLSKKLPTYPAYLFLNSRPPAVLYSYYDERMFYYYNGTFIGLTWGAGRFVDFEQSLEDGACLYNHLKHFNVDYLLVNKEIEKEYPPRYRTMKALPSDASFNKLFAKIYEDNAAIVYALK